MLANQRHQEGNGDRVPFFGASGHIFDGQSMGDIGEHEINCPRETEIDDHNLTLLSIVVVENVAFVILSSD